MVAVHRIVFINYCACVFKMADPAVPKEKKTIVKSNRPLESFRNESYSKSLNM